MSSIDPIVIILISLGLGFALGFFYVIVQITAIENRAGGTGEVKAGSCR